MKQKRNITTKKSTKSRSSLQVDNPRKIGMLDEKELADPRLGYATTDGKQLKPTAPVEAIHGIGPRTAANLHKQQIYTVGDLTGQSSSPSQQSARIKKLGQGKGTSSEIPETLESQSSNTDWEKVARVDAMSHAKYEPTAGDMSAMVEYAGTARRLSHQAKRAKAEAEYYRKQGDIERANAEEHNAVAYETLAGQYKRLLQYPGAATQREADVLEAIEKVSQREPRAGDRVAIPDLLAELTKNNKGKYKQYTNQEVRGLLLELSRGKKGTGQREVVELITVSPEFIAEYRDIRTRGGQARSKKITQAQQLKLNKTGEPLVFYVKYNRPRKSS